jgi:tetratricopeptide (TPR) repeat protein/O-antigen ligase
MKTAGLDKILRNIVIGGVFVIPLVIPFIVSTNLFFPFISGKGFTFRIISELLFGAWLLLAFRVSSYRPKFSWILAVLGLFMAVMAVADILSPNPLKSFWSNYERMEGYVTFIHLSAYFIVVGSVLNTEKIWQWFWSSSIFASVIMSFYGMLQLGGAITINQGGVRLDGTFGNAAYLAAYMLFNIFLALFLVLRKESPTFLKWFCGAAIFIDIFILYYTATRGAIVGLFGGLILAFFLVAIFERENKILRKIAIGIISFLILFGAGLLFVKDTNFIKSSPTLSRISSISLKDAGPRFMVWNMAWQGVKERPIFGWGQESFNFVFNKYYNPKMFAQEQWFDRAHNIVFDWLIAGGFLGFLSYFFLFIVSISYIWKKGNGLGHKLKKLFFSFWVFVEQKLRLGQESNQAPRWNVAEKSVLTGLFAGYFFQNFFVFDNIVNYILFFSLLAFIHNMFSRPFGALSSPKPFKIEDSGTFNRLFAPLVIVAVLFFVYFFNFKAFAAGTDLIQAIQAQNGGITKNLEYFKSAVSRNSFGNQEIREQLVQAIPQIMNSKTDQTIKQQFFDLARKEMQKQIDEVSGDARTQVFMGSFLARFGFYDDAMPYLEKALALSPNKQTVIFELGSDYLNKRDYEKSLKYLKEAFDLAPEWPEARIVYSIGAIYAGKTDLARSLLLPAFGTVYVVDDRLMQAYNNIGDYQSVIEIIKKKIEINPSDYQNYVSLAAVYLKISKRNDAIASLQKAVSLNSAYKEQGEYFIKEIKAGRNP